MYNVGDVVYVDAMVATTESVKHRGMTVAIVDSMRRYVGKKAIIKQVTVTGAYFIDIDGMHHHWTNEMFTKQFESPFQKWEKDAGVNETCIA
jgi:hypothetical protein